MTGDGIGLAAVRPTSGSSPWVEWLGDCDYSADDLLRTDEDVAWEKPTRQREAEAFLKEQLMVRAHSVVELVKLATDRGISERTLRRAAEALKVIHSKRKKAWHWVLPFQKYEIGSL